MHITQRRICGVQNNVRGKNRVADGLGDRLWNDLRSWCRGRGLSRRRRSRWQFAGDYRSPRKVCRRRRACIENFSARDQPRSAAKKEHVAAAILKGTQPVEGSLREQGDIGQNYGAIAVSTRSGERSSARDQVFRQRIII